MASPTLDLIRMSVIELAGYLEPFLDQAVLGGGLASWYLLSEGFLSKPPTENEVTPSIPSGPQPSDDIEFVIALDLEEPSQYHEVAASLFGYRETAPKSGRWMRQRQGNKIFVDLIPFYRRGVDPAGTPAAAVREGAELLFESAVVLPLQGYDFARNLRAFSVRAAKLSGFTLLKAHSFLQKQDPKQVVELCYGLEFLSDGSLRAGDELKPHKQSHWVQEGIQQLRQIFASPDAEGPVMYAKEHGVSMPITVRFRRQQAYALVKRLLNRFDGLRDEV